MAGAITQGMTAMTFIVMGILRSGLVTTRDALALILGGGVGVSALIVTFDIKAVALHVLGLAGQPWFLEMAEGTGDSLAFLVAALLTFIVQSSSAVTIFGISLAAVGLLSVDQAMSPLGPLARPEPARSLTMAWQATVLPISDVQRDLTPIRTGAFRNPVAVSASFLHISNSIKTVHIRICKKHRGGVDDNATDRQTDQGASSEAWALPGESGGDVRIQRPSDDLGD